MYPYFIILTPNDYEIINTASIIVLSLSLIGILVMWTIQMLQAERIAVLKNTLQIKDVRIDELELSVVLRYNTIDMQKEEISALKTRLEKYQKVFLGLSYGMVDCMKVADDSLRKFALTQSPQADKLEERIWDQEIEQEQKIGDRT